MNRKPRRDEQRKKGFTLVEILLVMTIMAMLAGVVAVSVSGTMERSKVRKARLDIQGLGGAIQSYYLNEGKYPPSLDVLASGDDPYLQHGVPLDPWGKPYQYAYPGSNRPFRYDLQTTTPDGKVIANWNLDERKDSTSGP